MNVQAPRDFIDRRQLLSALRSFRRGDFTVRLSEDLPGEDGEIARLFNETASLNEDDEESAPLSGLGKGARSQRAGQAATGAWGIRHASVTRGYRDMVQPAAEVAREESGSPRATWRSR